MSILTLLALTTITLAAPQAATTTTSATPSTSTSFILKANLTERDSLGSPWTGTHIQSFSFAQVYGGNPYASNSSSQFASGCQFTPGFPGEYPYYQPYYTYLNGTALKATSESYASGYGFHVGGKDETDLYGRRAVGVGRESCGMVLSTGFRISASEEEDGYEELQYDDGSGEGFGSWYVCSDNGRFLYGPALFYRAPDEVHPDGCADLRLVPECSSGDGLITPQGAGIVDASCYEDVGNVGV